MLSAYSCCDISVWGLPRHGVESSFYDDYRLTDRRTRPGYIVASILVGMLEVVAGLF